MIQCCRQANTVIVLSAVETKGMGKFNTIISNMRVDVMITIVPAVEG